MAMTKYGSTYYLTYDQVDSLRVVADAVGNVIKRVDYDSFGNIINDTNPSFDIPFGFAGGINDQDTGLVRFGFRDYDPDIGRWTAKDPILFAGGDTDLYGYCMNDPVRFMDPEGKVSIFVAISACFLTVSLTDYATTWYHWHPLDVEIADELAFALRQLEKAETPEETQILTEHIVALGIQGGFVKGKLGVNLLKTYLDFVSGMVSPRPCP